MSDKIEPDSSMVVSLEEIVCEKQKEGKRSYSLQQQETIQS